MDFVCPGDPAAWDGRRFTPRNARRSENARMGFLEKWFVFGVPGFAACLSFLEIVMLIKNKIEGKAVVNYESFFRSSQFLVWMVVGLVSVHGPWFVFYNPIMCFCWILKILLEIPHLQYKLTVLKAVLYFKEIISFSMAIVFGLFVVVSTVVDQPRNKREMNSIEDPLVPDDEKAEAEVTNLENNQSIWELLTFKFVNPMMDIGITRQLDFTDLLELPVELRAASSYEKLLSSWTVEHQHHHSDSSLLRAMSNAYGWTYLRLGLLKVINDSIGFVSPLLLNKFIKFLQQGSGGADGYILAISLGLTSIIKSFLDSQYSFRLAKLKLMLRSSIMGIIYRKCLCLSLSERSRFSEGEIQTFMSVDSDRTINLCNSLHDAWRISCAGELLAHIRTVKMYSWERLFTQRLVERRELEVKHLATRKYLDAWCVYFWATTPTLFSLFTFSIFAIMGHSLDAATVFTCVALFNTLISPLNSFPWVINGMIDAVISSRRLSKYLSSPEKRSSAIPASADLLKHHNTETNVNAMAVILRNVCCSWSISSIVESSMILRDVSLELQKGIFVAIIGEVGCGKSSLLNSIIGEIHVTSGSITSYGSIAYVPQFNLVKHVADVVQVPWILSGSLRDNILLGEEFDPRRYEEVIHACTLDVDISAMVGGDMSHIGEKGLNLSGGQRARLALARALYHDSDVYLFDDVLSSVDSQVASYILEKAIMGPQMKRKTRILSTHNLQAISAADMIVVMANGLVKWFGTLDSFLATPYSTLSKPESSRVISSTFSEKNKGVSVAHESETNGLVDNDSVVDHEEQREQNSVEARKEGMVELSVYKKYAAFAGWSIAFLICLSAFLMQASRNGNDLWLTYWVDTSTGSSRTIFYLTILAAFGALNSFFTLGRAFSFAYGGLCAAIQIHADLLNNLIGAPVSFFDQNPSGRILNRLSSDLYAIDDSLPFILNIFVANFFSLLGTLVVISYSQFYYRSTSREVRRLDSVARSPIYSSFTETLDGSSTIRAFQKEGFFLERFIQHVTIYQKTSYCELVAGLWLSLRLQLLAGFIILFIAIMAIVGFNSKSVINFGTPGLVGLALSYAAPVVSLLNGFLTTFTETEKEMISVERVVEYVGIPQEELHGSESPHSGWPTEGNIEFEHVTLRYKEDLPPALNDVSFFISSGMQVGIIGRTGAGKSSILNALLRLAPICNGRILVDDFDVAKLAVRDLREHFAVVPQSPFLFDGSLRTTDLRIWEALDKCHMKTEIESIGGLDIHVKESGASFSVGQRQLLCLARAILKSSKILCLDECTANVDNQTASLLQNTISAECKGMTVLTIAHRISTVMKMDSVLVLDQGKLVEEGNPEVLVDDKFSRFSRFAKASNM
uniref:ABC transporter C family member 13 n=1 Tax=Oryza meridionalis TaxID=40149 RepID=A0A0E0DY11_9ORYZ